MFLNQLGSPFYSRHALKTSSSSRTWTTPIMSQIYYKVPLWALRRHEQAYKKQYFITDLKPESSTRIHPHYITTVRHIGLDSLCQCGSCRLPRNEWNSKFCAPSFISADLCLACLFSCWTPEILSAAPQAVHKPNNQNKCIDLYITKQSNSGLLLTNGVQLKTWPKPTASVDTGKTFHER